DHVRRQLFLFLQAEDGIRDRNVTGVQTCALPISKTQPVERSRVISFIPMFVASVAFWALFQQQFTVLAIYSDQRLDRTLGGWEMPAKWVQFINQLFIIIFDAVFATQWSKLGDRKPSMTHKLVLTIICYGDVSLVLLMLSGST